MIHKCTYLKEKKNYAIHFLTNYCSNKSLSNNI